MMRRTILQRLVASLPGLTLVSCSGIGKTKPFSLAEAGTIQLPENFMADGDAAEDDRYLKFSFRQVYRHDISGTTSYSENLTVLVLAPDTTVSDMEGLGRGEFDPGDHVEDRRQWEMVTENGLRFETQAVTYKQNLVVEPSWMMRVSAPADHLVLSWRGFQKGRSVEQARGYLAQIYRSFQSSGQIEQVFASVRDWPGHRAANVKRNRAAIDAALAELHLPPVREGAWTESGSWLYTINMERPQQFVFGRYLGHLTLPDKPVGIKGDICWFRYFSDHWFQEAGPEYRGPFSIRPTDPVLGKRLADAGAIYFYSFTKFNYWDGPGPETGLFRGIQEFQRASVRLESDLLTGMLTGIENEP